MTFQKLLIGEGRPKVVIMGRHELQGTLPQPYGQLMVRRPASQPMTHPAGPLHRHAAAQSPYLPCAAFDLFSGLLLLYSPFQDISDYSQSVDFTHAQPYYFGVVHPMRVPQKRTFLKNADRTF